MVAVMLKLVVMFKYQITLFFRSKYSMRMYLEITSRIFSDLNISFFSSGAKIGVLSPTGTILWPIFPVAGDRGVPPGL